MNVEAYFCYTLSTQGGIRNTEIYVAIYWLHMFLQYDFPT